ncbi:hypothetical protein PR048_014418 [Dryococelus australis]|uniref:Uncharacterized protein n=1 Tax=Dryococelus australis TaxID=614101 RepID=A0ABQ9HEE6_9NEOP|nr:hypothetical protein PR048_014418 [Dryococelus australis]
MTHDDLLSLLAEYSNRTNRDDDGRLRDDGERGVRGVNGREGVIPDDRRHGSGVRCWPFAPHPRPVTTAAACLVNTTPPFTASGVARDFGADNASLDTPDIHCLIRLWSACGPSRTKTTFKTPRALQRLYPRSPTQTVSEISNTSKTCLINLAARRGDKVRGSVSSLLLPRSCASNGQNSSRAPPISWSDKAHTRTRFMCCIATGSKAPNWRVAFSPDRYHITARELQPFPPKGWLPSLLRLASSPPEEWHAMHCEIAQTETYLPSAMDLDNGDTDADLDYQPPDISQRNLIFVSETDSTDSEGEEIISEKVNLLKTDKDLKFGDSYYAVCGEISVAKWKDRGIESVVFISNMHNPGNSSIVERKDNPGIFSRKSGGPGDGVDDTLISFALIALAFLTLKREVASAPWKVCSIDRGQVQLHKSPEERKVGKKSLGSSRAPPRAESFIMAPGMKVVPDPAELRQWEGASCWTRVQGNNFSLSRAGLGALGEKYFQGGDLQGEGMQAVLSAAFVARQASDGRIMASSWAGTLPGALFERVPHWLDGLDPCQRPRTVAPRGAWTPRGRPLHRTAQACRLAIRSIFVYPGSTTAVDTFSDSWGRGDAVVRRLASHQGESGSILNGLTKFLACGKRGGRCCRLENFLGALLFSPLWHFAAAPSSPHFTLTQRSYIHLSLSLSLSHELLHAGRACATLGLAFLQKCASVSDYITPRSCTFSFLSSARVSLWAATSRGGARGNESRRRGNWAGLSPLVKVFHANSFTSTLARCSQLHRFCFLRAGQRRGERTPGQARKGGCFVCRSRSGEGEALCLVMARQLPVPARPVIYGGRTETGCLQTASVMGDGGVPGQQPPRGYSASLILVSHAPTSEIAGSIPGIGGREIFCRGVRVFSGLSRFLHRLHSSTSPPAISSSPHPFFGLVGAAGLSPGMLSLLKLSLGPLDIAALVVFALLLLCTDYTPSWWGKHIQADMHSRPRIPSKITPQSRDAHRYEIARRFLLRGRIHSLIRSATLWEPALCLIGYCIPRKDPHWLVCWQVADKEEAKWIWSSAGTHDRGEFLIKPAKILKRPRQESNHILLGEGEGGALATAASTAAPNIACQSVAPGCVLACT